MSEQPAPYGDHPVPAPLITRVERVERDLVRIADIQAQNVNAIAGLVNAVDQMRSTFDSRLAAIETQLSAIHQSNQLLIELLTSRLPPPAKEE
jgi:hypothetical protein